MQRMILDLSKGLDLSKSDLSSPFNVTRLPLWQGAGPNFSSHPGHDIISAIGVPSPRIEYSDTSGVIIFPGPEVRSIPDAQIASKALQDWAFIPRLGAYYKHNDEQYAFLKPVQSPILIERISLEPGKLEAGEYYVWALSFSRLGTSLFLNWYSAQHVIIGQANSAIRVKLTEEPGDDRLVKIYVQRRVGGKWTPLIFLRSLSSGDRELLYSAHTEEGEYEDIAIPRGSGKKGTYFNARYFYPSRELLVLGASDAPSSGGAEGPPAPDPSSVFGYSGGIFRGFGSLVANSSPSLLDMRGAWDAWANTDVGSFVAKRVGTTTKIYFAPDGLRWGWREVYSTNKTITTATWSPGAVVFAGPGVVLYAPLTGTEYLNPNRWQEITIADTATPVDADYHGSLFAIITDTKLWTSQDGQSWSIFSPPPSLLETRTFKQVVVYGGRVIIQSHKPVSDGFLIDYFVYNNGSWSREWKPVHFYSWIWDRWAGASEVVHRRFSYMYRTTENGEDYIRIGFGVKAGSYWYDFLAWVDLPETDYHYVYPAASFLTANPKRRDETPRYGPDTQPYGASRKLGRADTRAVLCGNTVLYAFLGGAPKHFNANGINGLLATSSAPRQPVLAYDDHLKRIDPSLGVVPFSAFELAAQSAEKRLYFVATNWSGATKVIYAVNTNNRLESYALLPPAPRQDLGPLVSHKVIASAERNNKLVLLRETLRGAWRVVDILKGAVDSLSFVAPYKEVGIALTTQPLMHFDGTKVWFQALAPSRIIEVNVDTGAQRNISLPSNSIAYFADDGTDGYVGQDDKVYKIDPNTQTLTSVYTAPSGTSISGLASGNGKIYIGLSNNSLIELNTSTNTATTLATLPDKMRYGRTNGTAVLVVGYGGGLYRYQSGSVDTIYVPPTNEGVITLFAVGGSGGGGGGGGAQEVPAPTRPIRLQDNTIIWTEPNMVNVCRPYSWHTFASRQSRNINEIASHPAGVLVFMDAEVYVMSGRFTSIADTRVAPYPAQVGLDAGGKLSIIGDAIFLPWGGRLYMVNGGNVEPISLKVDDGVPFVAVLYDATNGHLVARKADGRVLRYNLLRGAWFDDFDGAEDIAYYYDGSTAKVVYVAQRSDGAYALYSVFSGGDPSLEYRRPSQEIWIDAVRGQGEPIKRIRAIYINVKGQGPANASVEIYNEDETLVASMPMTETLASNVSGLGRYRAIFPPVVSYAPARIRIAFAGFNFDLSPLVEVHYEVRQRKV